jgi:hypothetical protein
MSNFKRIIHVGLDIINEEISFSYIGEDGKGAALSLSKGFLGKKAYKRLSLLAEDGW